MLDTLRRLINPHCTICGEIRPFVSPQARLCTACREDLNWIAQPCLRCGLPMHSLADECGECLTLQPCFQHSAIPWAYEFPVSGLVRAFKHQGRDNFGRLLAIVMVDYLREHYRQRPWPQALLPIPLHPRREQKRGFNQAAEIAALLARQLNLPLLDDLIVRTRDTDSQQGLNRQQRKRNLNRAFTAIQDTGFRRVAIIDDVVTTGSTVDAVAEQLRLLGVRDIHVWAFARTPSIATG